MLFRSFVYLWSAIAALYSQEYLLTIEEIQECPPAGDKTYCKDQRSDGFGEKIVNETGKEEVGRMGEVYGLACNVDGDAVHADNGREEGQTTASPYINDEVE